MGKVNFTAERVNELLVKTQSMPDVADVATKTYAAQTFQPQGEYAPASVIPTLAKADALAALTAAVEGLAEQLSALKARFETLLGEGDVSSVIDSFNEIETFLSGVTNTQTLTGMLAEQRAEIVGMIPTGTAKASDLTALTARVGTLETSSATHTASIETLQSDMAKRPALPSAMADGAVYAIENGQYAKIFDSADVVLVE